MNPATQRIYPNLGTMPNMDRYSPTQPYRQRMQQTSSIFGALENPFQAAQAAQALVEMDVKNVNMSANMLRPTDMFSNYHPPNLLNPSAGNSDLIGNNGLTSVANPASATNLIDSQAQNGAPSSANDAIQQVMAMQHHYPSAHFSPYHQLPPASVAAAAFGQPPNAGMIGGGQSAGNLNGQGGFVGNPLQGVHANTILPRTSGIWLFQRSTLIPRELERFAEHFKQRRIKLGVTQADVGKALAHLKMPGVGSLSQSTICRFESLTLSHNNMVALKPILHSWLEKAEDAIKNKAVNAEVIGILPASDKKRKRTSIAAPEKRLLEDYFRQQPRPTGDRISAIAEKLDLKKNVVRVWFCNQRQKQKRQFRCRNQQALTGAQSISSMHSTCTPTPQQNQQPPQELKYVPSTDDLIRKQLLGEDFLQQLPQVIQQQQNNLANDGDMQQPSGHLD
ncbi:POU domain protein [Aphelenchoides bicaudatus]|nr:POU domain protein [Aphelenchoides bicaudatus]